MPRNFSVVVWECFALVRWRKVIFFSLFRSSARGWQNYYDRIMLKLVCERGAHEALKFHFSFSTRTESFTSSCVPRSGRFRDQLNDTCRSIAIRHWKSNCRMRFLTHTETTKIDSARERCKLNISAPSRRSSALNKIESGSWSESLKLEHQLHRQSIAAFEKAIEAW